MHFSERKLIGSKIDKLPVMELFYTIQGEGIHSGRAAVFLRLGGCDVGCVWCDVKESWNADAHPLFNIDYIITEVKKYSSRFIVITGGEPAMQDLTKLTEALHQSGFEIAIETSGAYHLKGTFDWICVSPKKFKVPLNEVLVQADEMKVVIYHASDFEWAEQFRSQLKKECALILQPEYSRFEIVVPPIVEYIKQHPEWRISIQTHKYMRIP